MSEINRKSLDNFYDVIVIGGGPAGLTAALYLARAQYRALVIEKEQFGGQITITSEVVNYPGVYTTNGSLLTDTMQRQAENFGADFLLADATALSLTDDVKTVHTNRGDYQCLGILIATGAHPRVIGFKGEEENKGHGVAYCATCDGEFFTGKDIFVVGGGFAAAEESVFLTKFARHVTILMITDDFTCAASVAEHAKNHKKITILTNTAVEEVAGNGGLTYIRYKNLSTNEVTEFTAANDETFGVFVFAGYCPETSLVEDIVSLDEQGYIITDKSQATNVEGVYAAGDVCIKPLRQVVTAVGDGATAATELEKYVSKMQKKTGLRAPKKQVTALSSPASGNSAGDSAQLFTAEMKAQLDTVFSKMEHPLLLRLYLDNRPVSAELKKYILALTSMTDKLSMSEEEETEKHKQEAPCVRVCHADGTETGLAFHGVPGGHEFTSFILGLYNASGSGQSIDEESASAIAAITSPVSLKVLVSLSCTMCPELVTATQKIASLNANVAAEVYDLNHFQELKEKYQVMSVPCLVLNDQKVFFGKKNIKQILDLI